MHHKRARRIYVAHPLRGKDEQKNRAAVEAICRRLAQDPALLPLSPINAFDFCDTAGPQDVPFRLCRDLLSLCDELHLYGRWWESEGCRMELSHALSLGLPVQVCPGAPEEAPAPAQQNREAS